MLRVEPSLLINHTVDGILGFAHNQGRGVVGHAEGNAGVRGEGPIGVSGEGNGNSGVGVQGQGLTGVVGNAISPDPNGSGAKFLKCMFLLGE